MSEQEYYQALDSDLEIRAFRGAAERAGIEAAHFSRLANAADNVAQEACAHLAAEAAFGRQAAALDAADRLTDSFARLWDAADFSAAPMA